MLYKAFCAKVELICSMLLNPGLAYLHMINIRKVRGDPPCLDMMKGEFSTTTTRGCICAFSENRALSNNAFLHRQINLIAVDGLFASLGQLVWPCI